MRFVLLLAGAWAGIAALSLLRPTQEKDFGKRPDWTLPDPDGKKVSASDFDQKVVIVDFWATWCPPCRREVPGFMKLLEKYKDRGLAIVGLSADNDPKTHADWLKENKVTYPSLYLGTEEGKKAVEKFENLIGPIEAYPTTLVIDRKGHIVFRHEGFATPEEFEKVFVPLLAP